MILGVHTLGRTPLGSLLAAEEEVPYVFVADAERACVHWENKTCIVAFEYRIAVVPYEARVYATGVEGRTGDAYNRKRKC